MASSLRVSVGQFSDAGRKPSNQDFHGLCLPREPQLGTKGVALAVADGISSSDAGSLAAQAAVTGFLADYYCTSDAWTVRTSVQRVLAAVNSWLYSQTQAGQGRFDKDRGHVCTFAALVLRSATAHLFHAGDTRIGQLHGGGVEWLTQDHRVQVAPGRSHLARAFGVDRHVELDHRTVALTPGDLFIVCTDGVHEHVPGPVLAQRVAAHAADLDAAARAIGEEALRRGSDDNLTLQLVRIEALPDPQADEVRRQLQALPCPGELHARSVLDGWRIERELHASHRSRLYLARPEDGGAPAVLKTPGTELKADPAALERFLLEEWIARRLDSPHVLRPHPLTRRRTQLWVAMEFVEGRTLAQWMRDHPRPDVATVRALVAQMAKGLRAFHRLEMLHQDLRPENVMVDAAGTVKIIDFGSVHVAGLAEAAPAAARAGAEGAMPGTASHSAPECFIGDEATTRTDQYALGVIAYQLFTGRLPYGVKVAQCRSRADARRLAYEPIVHHRHDVPAWVDEAIRKAVHPDPAQRYEDLSEFVHDLHHPARAFVQRRRPPLIERHPVAFWKGVSLLLAGVIVGLLKFGALGH